MKKENCHDRSTALSGFESNKSLSAIKVACPACKAEMEMFSDEIDKKGYMPQMQGDLRSKKLQSIGAIKAFLGMTIT